MRAGREAGRRAAAACGGAAALACSPAKCALPLRVRLQLEGMSSDVSAAAAAAAALGGPIQQPQQQQNGPGLPLATDLSTSSLAQQLSASSAQSGAGAPGNRSPAGSQPASELAGGEAGVDNPCFSSKELAALQLSDWEIRPEGERIAEPGARRGRGPAAPAAVPFRKKQKERKAGLSMGFSPFRRAPPRLPPVQTRRDQGAQAARRHRLAAGLWRLWHRVQGDAQRGAARGSQGAGHGEREPASFPNFLFFWDWAHGKGRTWACSRERTALPLSCPPPPPCATPCPRARPQSNGQGGLRAMSEADFAQEISILRACRDSNILQFQVGEGAEASIPC